MTWQQNIFQILIVTSSAGTPTGFFEYSGAPVAGNPPISYAAAPGVTTDPFGNALPSSAGGFTSVSAVTVAFLNGNTLAFRNITAPPNFFAQLSGFGSTSGTDLSLNSGRSTAGAQAVEVDLLDSSQSSQLVSQMVINRGLASSPPTTTALLEVQGTIQSSGLNSIIAGGNLQSSLGDIFASSGNVRADTVGKGFRAKEGLNGKQGAVLLAAGTATVNNTNVTASSRIFLTAQDNLSTGALRVSARTAGTSFTITSSVAGDSGSVAWEIFEPA